MVSPAIDLQTALQAAELSFGLYALGDGLGEFSIGVSTSASGPFTAHFAWGGDLQRNVAEDWYPVRVDISPYIGQAIFLEIKYKSISDHRGDLCLDDLKVKSCKSCASPYQVSADFDCYDGATINWLSQGGAAAWDIFLTTDKDSIPTALTAPSYEEISAL